MAKLLAAKGYNYQFMFARNAGHVDYKVRQQTLPEALEWLWKGYRAVKEKDYCVLFFPLYQNSILLLGGSSEIGGL